jgi:hypothetical protein
MVFLDTKCINDSGEYWLKLKIIEVLQQGIKAVLRNKKFIILFWGTNAVFAFILSMPIFHVLLDNLQYSLISPKLAVKFDFMWFEQFKFIYRSNLNEIPTMIYGLLGIYVLMQTFYLGGLISVFNFPKKDHIVDFFYGGVRYWFRFTKVLLVSLIFFAIAFKINDYLGDLITLIFKDTENVFADFIFRSLRYVLLIFFIGLITIISDYSKVAIAVREKRKVIKEILNTMMFIKRNFYKVFTIFLIVAVLGAVGAVIYNLIGMAIPRTPYHFLILTFILQQMLIIFRLLIRMLFYSTEVILFKDLSADLITAQAEEYKTGIQ